jgi:hypothetical protein
MRSVFVIACLLASLAGGCSFWGDDEDRCVSVEEYQDAGTAPLITVPDGLDRPGPALRMDIPDVPPPAQPLSQTVRCLQEPPDFFDRPLKKTGEEN